MRPLPPRSGTAGRSPLPPLREGGGEMTCGMCKHCVPLDICGGDCECKAREIEVSEDDDTRFYGEDNEPCELFVTA